MSYGKPIGIQHQRRDQIVKTVTVIIPTYNREKRLERSIASVLEQDYPNVEIIVVDDGSTDSTEAVIKMIAERNLGLDKRISYIRQDNHGACVARNRGMMLATGDYIMFLDSDDLLDRTKLSIQVAQIETDNSQCAICDFECLDEAGNIVMYRNNNRHPHDFIRTFASPSISTVLMRRDSIPPGLQWNARLKRIQDVDFMYKYFASIDRWSYINQALFQYCLHSGVRISDTYSKGIQYSELRNSLKTYLGANRSFITTDSAMLYRDYIRVLRKHQFRNALVKLIPVSLKRLLKRLQATE